MTPIRLSQPRWPTGPNGQTHREIRIVYVNPDAIQRFHELKNGGSVVILRGAAGDSIEVDESPAEIDQRLLWARREAAVDAAEALHKAGMA